MAIQASELFEIKNLELVGLTRGDLVRTLNDQRNIHLLEGNNCARLLPIIQSSSCNVWSAGLDDKGVVVELSDVSEFYKGDVIFNPGLLTNSNQVVFVEFGEE